MRKAVQVANLPGFQWMDGMRNGAAGKGGRFYQLKTDEHGTWVESYRNDGRGVWAEPIESSWPDLKDPGTIGCLMSLMSDYLRILPHRKYGFVVEDIIHGHWVASQSESIGEAIADCVIQLGKWPGGEA